MYFKTPICCSHVPLVPSPSLFALASTLTYRMTNKSFVISIPNYLSDHLSIYFENRILYKIQIVQTKVLDPYNAYYEYTIFCSFI